mmetsp:Transcript_63016/g.186130  ORF Transcript_63016/g.186130 Transcript_63016/m.186130 type:complete len:253 (-) Transcript_63016:589-1347(-)
MIDLLRMLTLDAEMCASILLIRPRVDPCKRRSHAAQSISSMTVARDSREPMWFWNFTFRTGAFPRRRLFIKESKLCETTSNSSLSEEGLVPFSMPNTRPFAFFIFSEPEVTMFFTRPTKSFTFSVDSFVINEQASDRSSWKPSSRRIISASATSWFDSFPTKYSSNSRIADSTTVRSAPSLISGEKSKPYALTVKSSSSYISACWTTVRTDSLSLTSSSVEEYTDFCADFVACAISEDGAASRSDISFNTQS